MRAQARYARRDSPFEAVARGPAPSTENYLSGHASWQLCPFESLLVRPASFPLDSKAATSRLGLFFWRDAR